MPPCCHSDKEKRKAMKHGSAIMMGNYHWESSTMNCAMPSDLWNGKSLMVKVKIYHLCHSMSMTKDAQTKSLPIPTCPWYKARDDPIFSQFVVEKVLSRQSSDSGKHFGSHWCIATGIYQIRYSKSIVCKSFQKNLHPLKGFQEQVVQLPCLGFLVSISYTSTS